MKRKIITTADGSKTIQIEDWNEQYHSVHGAIQEANHVFIKHGLLFYVSKYPTKPSTESIHLLEIGFGTGLNAFLSLLQANNENINLNYTGVEAYPVAQEEIELLNYVQLIDAECGDDFNLLHQCSWDAWTGISSNFQLLKQRKFFHQINNTDEFDLVYFDAFGARVQPDLWTEDIFSTMYTAMRLGGVLVTYSAKGSVRRAMEAVGFKVERLPGPPGKREMLRALKVQ